MVVEKREEVKLYGLQSRACKIRRLVSTHLLFNLQLIHNRCQFGEDFVCLLMVFELSSDEIGEIAKGFGGVEDLFGILC